MFQLPVSAQWNTVRFQSERFSRECLCSHMPYSLLHGENFFSDRLAGLDTSRVTFSWDQQDVQIEPTKITTGNAVHQFNLTIDTAFIAHDVEPILWQSFAGHWVKTKQPCFSPHIATLMDIDKSSTKSPLDFVYVLPTSSQTALIEHTCFSIEPLSPEMHLKQCELWLKKKGIQDWEIERSEKGLIPMGFQSASECSEVISFGSNSGAIRASTGYAFLNILRQAEELANQIKNASLNSYQSFYLPHVDFHPKWMEISDRLFLKALKRTPMNGSMIMSNLLSRAPEQSLIRFLSGNITFLDAMSVMIKAPKSTMLRALCYE